MSMTLNQLLFFQTNKLRMFTTCKKKRKKKTIINNTFNKANEIKAKPKIYIYKIQLTQL